MVLDVYCDSSIRLRYYPTWEAHVRSVGTRDISKVTPLVVVKYRKINDMAIFGGDIILARTPMGGGRQWFSCDPVVAKNVDGRLEILHQIRKMGQHSISASCCRKFFVLTPEIQVNTLFSIIKEGVARTLNEVAKAK